MVYRIPTWARCYARWRCSIRWIERRAHFAAPALVLFVAAGCGDQPHPEKTPAGPGASQIVDLPQADQRLCTAVTILIDTSGSMTQMVRDRSGSKRPKYRIAQDAIKRIIDYTQTWTVAHPDRTLLLGVFNFSSSAGAILPTEAFDVARARAAIERIPSPGGGTAIGEALEAGFKSLYATGCVRKHIICITDGENTSGPAPDRVARALFAQTAGEVELHFVAFDTSASKFGFLKDVNGHAVEAADGEQLAAKLSDIYEKQILAEAMPAERP
jgi:Mg-chelatase subunit ChlD